jgi:hypothetical protein
MRRTASLSSRSSGSSGWSAESVTRFIGGGATETGGFGGGAAVGSAWAIEDVGGRRDGVAEPLPGGSVLSPIVVVVVDGVGDVSVEARPSGSGVADSETGRSRCWAARMCLGKLDGGCIAVLSAEAEPSAPFAPPAAMALLLAAFFPAPELSPRWLWPATGAAAAATAPAAEFGGGSLDADGCEGKSSSSSSSSSPSASASCSSMSILVGEGAPAPAGVPTADADCGSAPAAGSV